MKLIDTNALVLLLVGLMDIRLIKNHDRTSFYDEQDFYDLRDMIGSIDQLVVLPNVWTETDNLLNKFSGNYKYPYLLSLTESMKLATEKYVASIKATESYAFFDLGLTDSLLLGYAQQCDMLVTADSTLSDYAVANGILVYDLVKIKNDRLK